MSDMEDADRDSPRKIVFLLPSMSGGGAEKVILHILSYLDRTKFNPHLLLFQKKGVFLDRVPSDVPIHSLMDRKSPVNRWLLCFYYKKYISKSNPDVVVSFMWYPNIIVLLQKYFFKGRHKVIVSERNTTAFTSGGRLNGLIRRWGIRFFYPRADLVISLTYRMRQELLEMCNIKSGRIAVIRNPVDIQALKAASREPIDMAEFDGSLPVVLAIGSLTTQKGFEYLIRAFARIIKTDRARLVILGEGKKRCLLEELIHQLGIKEYVHLPGFQNNPHKYLVHSTVFVLSSIYEGLPNAMMEAMALGVPCIATRCPTGPEEIINDGINGLLVPPADEKALAEAITRVLRDVGLQERLSEAGKRRVKDFAVERIVSQYEEEIMNVIGPVSCRLCSKTI